ncbi:MAG: 4-(cytidine 5'-diphospho)-2-C-methyl-D-erythritol kinase [Desulfobacterales bacterium]
MKILSPAKINLFLEVIQKRSDGYHDIVSLMCPVSLYDSISFDFVGHSIGVSCDHPDVPEDETNLAFRAAALFKDLVGDRNLGLLMKIEKKIPVAAGLGGGSSNAATVLKVLNQRYSKPFSLDQLQKFGLEIGADVPFFVLGKPAIASGIGEQLELYDNMPDYKVLLIYPDIKVSTAVIYKNLNLRLTNYKKKPKYPIFKNQDFNFKSHLQNDLEVVAATWYPEILEIKHALICHGADAALMSGSGSTVFGLFQNPIKACKAMKRLSKHEAWQMFLVDILL